MAYIFIYYIDLLKGRLFIFIVTYGVMLNRIIDFILAKVVVVYNLMDMTLKILKGMCIGIIYECEDIVNFVGSFKGALIVLAAVIIVLLMPFDFGTDGQAVAMLALIMVLDIY